MELMTKTFPTGKRSFMLIQQLEIEQELKYPPIVSELCVISSFYQPDPMVEMMISINNLMIHWFNPTNALYDHEELTSAGKNEVELIEVSQRNVTHFWTYWESSQQPSLTIINQSLERFTVNDLSFSHTSKFDAAIIRQPIDIIHPVDTGMMFLSDEPTTVPSYQDSIRPPVISCKSPNEYYQIHYEELPLPQIPITVIIIPDHQNRNEETFFSIPTEQEVEYLFKIDEEFSASINEDDEPLKDEEKKPSDFNEEEPLHLTDDNESSHSTVTLASHDQVDHSDQCFLTSTYDEAGLLTPLNSPTVPNDEETPFPPIIEDPDEAEAYINKIAKRMIERSYKIHPQHSTTVTPSFNVQEDIHLQVPGQAMTTVEELLLEEELEESCTNTEDIEKDKLENRRNDSLNSRSRFTLSKKFKKLVRCMYKKIKKILIRRCV